MKAKKIKELKQLKLLANQIRQDIITSLMAAGSGHPAGSLGMAEVMTVLYFHILNHDPKRPCWEGRDFFILSNGHICPARYAAMANAGYFLRAELKTLRHFGSRLQGHPHRTALPGVETTSGPLGSGLSQAAGLAYAFRLDGKKNQVYCLMSDAEQQCGQTWEAVMFAGKNKLSNLTAIIDRNNIQISGRTEEVMPLEPLAEKYRAFHWQVLEVDAHHIPRLIKTFHQAQAVQDKPTLIIARSIPGKGVSFMENNFRWHGQPLIKEQGEIALRELKKEHERILRGESK